MIAFGIDPGCLRPGLPEIPFAKAFEEATEATIFRFFIPTAIWRALRRLNLGRERSLRCSLRRVDQFAYDVIAARRKELQSSTYTAAPGSSDLLTVFAGMKDDNGNAFCDKFLRDVCVNFILAGRDTSSVALAWFFWLLNQHPTVEQRILDEAKNILEGREFHEEEVVFQPEEVKRMDYLQAALSEALRLYPSVPVDHKEARTLFLKLYSSSNLARSIKLIVN